MKRSTSSLWYSHFVLDALELEHRRLVVGELEHAAEQDRQIDEVRAGALFDGGDHLVGKVGVGAAEIEVELDLCWHLSVSTRLRWPHQLSIQGLRSISWVQALRLLLMQLPVGLGDGLGAQDAVAVLERVALGKVAADELGVDRAVDHHVRDVDALRPELARHALRQRAQRVLGAGEGGEAGAAAHAGGGAGEQDGAAAARHHGLGDLAAHQEAGEAGHLPDLEVDARGRLADRESARWRRC